MAVELTFSSPLGMSEFERSKKALQFIEDVTKNADEVQGKLLADILTQNGKTEYLTRHGLGGATDREAFKAKVPVVRYEDLRDDIERIANGDRSPILSSHPISEFLTSSGTSRGERKLIPGVEKERAQKPIIDRLSMPVMNQYFSGLNKGKGLYFYFVKSETTTPCGLPARTALTSYYKSDYFQDPARRPYNVYTSPIEAILCPDIFQSMYAQMLCGLLQKKEVLRVGAIFPSGILRAVHFLQLNWRQLACDVETGTLFSKITDPSIREAVTKLMKPHPELAQFIASECSKGKWEGIISRMWPNTKYIDVIVTGSMAQYIPKLDYYSGGLPLASTLYACSECYFGINLRPICKPDEISYLILPNMGYFEFLPLDDDTSSSPNEKHAPPPFQPVDLIDVQIGKEYEIVITTYAGLYRYRVGDVLQVTGFHNSAPLFRFVRRRDVLLSIDADKTNEVELQAAVEKASELLKEFETSVVEYTSHADTNTIPGHYVIYWELSVEDSAKAPSHQVMEKCCLVMEESLNSVYRQSRVADKSIGALEIRVVRNGTFEELMEYAISKGASMNQYKVPRCVSFTPIMHMLNSRVLSTHFSPECPKWTPQRKG